MIAMKNIAMKNDVNISFVDSWINVSTCVDFCKDNQIAPNCNIENEIVCNINPSNIIKLLIGGI